MNTESATFGEKLCYEMPRHEAVRTLCLMRATGKKKCILANVGSESVVFIDITYHHETWKSIWKNVSMYYDRDRPYLPKSTNDMKLELYPALDHFSHSYSSLICELPRIHCEKDELPVSETYGPYFVPLQEPKLYTSILLEDDFEVLSIEISEHIHDAFNLLRVEASEILAFVATNCDRIIKDGIPPHLPVAYGLKGSSLSMETMRNMVFDVRKSLEDRNISIMCEVYDGQFHSFIVRSKDNYPLTLLQLQKDNFKKVMRNNDKRQLIDVIMKYSEVASTDIVELHNMPFQPNCTEELESVSIQMSQRGNCRVMSLKQLPIGHVTFDNFKTKYRENLWPKLMNSHVAQTQQIEPISGLTRSELCELVRGTRYHRQMLNRQASYVEEELLSSDSDDPDYLPDILHSSDEEHSQSLANTHSALASASNISVTSTGDSCLRSILSKLQAINNKHKWNEENVNTFLTKYFSSKANITKLFLYEMDIINAEIHTYFGKNVFNKKDKKKIRVNKFYEELRKLPQFIQYESSDDEEIIRNPLSLKEFAMKMLLNRKYPKEYLAACVCEINHPEELEVWKQRSTLPRKLSCPNCNDCHEIFSYPERSLQTLNLQMRTFDYTHILNNLRFHICNKGFNNVSKEAFLRVSDVDSSVLPRAIVEDKLDRQSCSLSQRFFSQEVQDILIQECFFDEAQFVSLVRNWFQACDARGMTVDIRLHHLNQMYHELMDMIDFSSYPPPTSNVGGIPIKTFEAMLHCISTRFALYWTSQRHCYNTRALSTLAVESFFSDLSKFEFSGLGTPKSTDIPKLLSHLVHINTTKHDPARGFEFTTSTRDNYPCYLMDIASQEIDSSGLFRNHPFDKATSKMKKKRKLLSISKPKCITRGVRGIRQFIRINEEKLTDEQRLGRNISMSEICT